MFRKLVNMLRPRMLEAEIREELEFHRSQTGGSFGRLTALQEQAREASVIVWLDTVLQDVRIAGRLLRRAPFTTAVALLSIALSIGATAVVFAAVKAVLLKPMPYRDAARLVQLRSDDDRAGPSNSDWIFWKDTEEIVRRTRTLAAVGVYRNAVLDLSGDAGSAPNVLYGLRITADLFPALGVAPMLGRNIKPEEDRVGQPEEIILSYGLWATRFGRNQSIVGRRIRINRHQCLVIGVMPPGFNFPLRRGAAHTPQPYVEFWTPMMTGGPQTMTGGMGAVARLRAGVSLAEARQDLESISNQLKREFPDSNRGRTLRLDLLQQREVGTARNALLLLFAAALLFLLIGCANVANLLLARGVARQREITVRMAVGAGGARILRQLLTESCVLSVLGGTGGYLLSLATWKFLPAIAPVTIPRLAEAQADGTILIFAIVLSVLNGLLFTVAPAWRSVHSASPAELHQLGTRSAGSARQDSIRSFLVAGEIALSLLLVAVGGQLLRSFLAVVNSDPGFDGRRIVAAVVLPDASRYQASGQRAAVYRRFLEAVRTISGVQEAGTIDALPFSGENHGGFIGTAQQSALDRQRDPVAEVDIVGGHYLQAMGVRLLAGRLFREDETLSASNNIVVNDVLARRLWPGKSPLGRHVCLDCTPEHPQNWKQIVGVVSTFRHMKLDGAPPMNIYEAGDAFANADFLVVRTDRPLAEVERAIRLAIARVDPDQGVLLVASLQSLTDDSVADRRFIVSMLTSTGLLALGMALAGVYGVTSYTTARRRQEIGIRMALGATASEVRTLILRQASLSIVFGLVMGLCLAWSVTRILHQSIPGFGESTMASFSVAGIVVAASAILACWLPVRRSTKIDPMRALRQE